MDWKRTAPVAFNSAMSGEYPMKLASRMLLAAVPVALLGASASATAESQRITDPLRFFEGRTESISTIKVIARKAYRSRTAGRGEIGRDGILHLVQQVLEDGRPSYDRRWRMRQVGPRRFTGTMSEAIGPVIVDEVGGRFRFRFKMKGNLSIEQWLTPLSGTAARSSVTIRKLGLKVGRSEGTIRKL